MKVFTMRWILAFFLLSSVLCRAQLSGNEWINYNQDYYRIKMGKEGIFRLDFNALKAAGFPVSTVNPAFIQLWRLGEEQPILVTGSADNTFDTTDYIEFYGTFNNGTTDSVLYPVKSEQPHRFMSLYTDTLSYFLTVSPISQGKRVTVITDKNYSGKTPDPYFLYDQYLWFTNKNSGTSYDGLGFSTEGFHSEYTEGEGWGRQFDGSGVKLSFLTPQMSSLGPRPVIEILAHSRANNLTAFDAEGYNNGITLTYDPSNTVINFKRVRGYDRYFFLDSLTRSFFGAATTTFKLASSVGAKSVHSASYLRLTYPRNFHLNDSANFKFRYNSANAFIKFQKYSSKKTKPFVYDILNHTRSEATLTGTDLYCNLTSASNTRQLLITDETFVNYIPASNIKGVKFSPVTIPTGTDYLIITHANLDSGAKAYRDFLASPAGGNRVPFIAYCDDLYDQYYYGLKHPQALKNFCRHAINSTPALKYLLLLGKGQKYSNVRFNPTVSYRFDLVPTYGIPPTDYYFTTGYNGSVYNPLLATGRVPATTNAQVAAYLQKLYDYRTSGYQTYKKKVLQLAGGLTATEVTQFVNFQNTFYNILKKPYWGASRKLITKSDPSPVDSSLKSKIQMEINQGYALVDYFGHGSTQASDIDLGEAYQLNNTNKYPFFYFNGCGLGNTYDGTSIAEDFIFTRNKGAIGWLAGTTFGYIAELNHFANILHTNLTERNTSSFAENISRSIYAYQMTNDFFNRAQCRQMVYVGDPSISIFDAEKPDYTLDGSVSKLVPERLTAESDSFGVLIHLQNLGLYKNDSFTISITQTIPGGNIIRHPAVWHKSFAHTDTVTVWLKRPKGLNIKGLNSFSITLDSANLVDEQPPLGESNNSSSFTYFFTSTAAQILFPRKDGILPSANVELVAQSLLYTGNDLNFVFELDTVPEFNSPYLKNSGTIRTSYIAKANFSLLPSDSMDYFWRVRIDDGSGNGAWDVSTFSVINGSPDGWSQGNFRKFADSRKSELAYDSTRVLEFLTTQSKPYVVECSGKTSSATWRTIWHDGYPLYFGYMTTQGVLCVAINPRNEERFDMVSKYNVLAKSKWWGDPANFMKKYYEKPGVSRSCSYLFNTFQKADRDSFLYWLQQVPVGYHLMILTGPTHNIPNWEPAIFDELSKFGALKTRTVLENEPYILVGQKGMQSGDAIEKLADPTNPLPGKDQYIFVNTTLNILADSGRIRSARIGPSRQWKTFYRTLKTPDSPNDIILFNLNGIAADGQVTPLFTNLNTRETDLSGVDANLYPYMEVEAVIEDSINKTPTDISRWTVLFEGTPEGAINPQVKLSQSNDTIDEGDTIAIQVAYSNISSFNMDSVLVLITHIDNANHADTLVYRHFSDLKSLKDLIISHKLRTVGFRGNNLLRVNVNPGMEQPEQYLFNNTWDFPFLIRRDQKRPYLDVVFDGRHITNMEIINPRPEISMTAVDDNKFLFLDDPTYFTVKLKEPGSSVYKTLNVLSDTFTFIPAKGADQKARLVYSPVGLKDGIYELSVAIRDGAGNFSADEEYTISFQIITKAAITNVFPYPNPFTSKTRFVFTLTGEKVPDQVKITIMTVSGKVVREITEDELGPLNIGNNLTTFEWNGTDEFGDKLANGVYLYKVSAKMDGKELENRETAGDAGFAKGIGKIYIMR